MISAYRKAASLRNHAQYLGAPMDEFVLPLTVREAFELLDEMQKGFNDQGGCMEFDRDLTEAKRSNNPWSMLNDAKVMGFDIVYMAGEMQ